MMPPLMPVMVQEVPDTDTPLLPLGAVRVEPLLKMRVEPEVMVWVEPVS